MDNNNTAPNLDSRFGWLETDSNEPAALVRTSAPAAPVVAPVVTPAAPVVTPAPAPAPAPVAAEPTMLTPAGVPMSPRMARFQRWCDAHKLGLTTFSTDTHVQALLPRLTALRDELAGRIDAWPGDDLVHVGPAQAMSIEMAEDLLRDVEGIMRRIPANRSGGSAATAPVTAQVAAPVTAPIAARNTAAIVAVEAETETTGAVVYWQLAGDVNRTDLVAAWEAEGLATALLPDLCSPEVALARAVSELAARRVMVRKNDGAWFVVRETPHPEKGLVHETVAKILLRDGDIEVTAIVEGYDPEYIASAAVQVRAEYQRNRALLTGKDISAWLVWLASKLNGVPLRERGGIYFFPCATVETLRKVKSALSAAGSSHVVNEIPALRSAEAVAAIFDALNREVRDEVAAIEEEIAQEIGKRAAANRMNELDALTGKVRSYEALLGQSLADMLTKIADTRGKLAKVADTRFALLETK